MAKNLHDTSVFTCGSGRSGTAGDSSSIDGSRRSMRIADAANAKLPECAESAGDASVEKGCGKNAERK